MDNKEKRLAKLKRAFKTWKNKQPTAEDYQPEVVSLDRYIESMLDVTNEQESHLPNFA